MRRLQKGFTIIELVVVIVILGVLAAVAFPKFQDLSNDAKLAVVNGAAGAIKSAAVISFAKNQGTRQSFAAVRSQTSLDTNITTSGTCTAGVVVGYSGTNSVTIPQSALSDFCVG